MAWEWLLVGFTWLGIRKRRSLRDLIGGRWASLEDFTFDVMIAAGFWVVSTLVLGAAGKLMHLDQGGRSKRCGGRWDFCCRSRVWNSGCGSS